MEAQSREILDLCEAALRGDADSQSVLGDRYRLGDGVDQDFAEAVRWFQLAADQGVAQAQCNLGGMFYEGSGVPHDFAKATHWNRLAAEQGHARAEFNLGAMYQFGEGVPEDAVQAVRWYRLAAEQGEATAQNNLGGMLCRAQVCRWISPKGHTGSGLRRSKVMRTRNAVSVRCTKSAKACRKMMSRRKTGWGLLPHRGMPRRSGGWG